MLIGLAQVIDLRESDLSDIRTAVTEACNNVVVHAYGSGEGPLEIEVHVVEGALKVMVRDRGSGIPLPDGIIEEGALGEEGAFGIGLPVIRALVQSVEFEGPAGGGTEVRMRFAAPDIRGIPPLHEDGLAPPATARAELGNAIVLTASPTRLAGTILPRLLSVLAARAHFSTDRICDAQLLADALLSQAPESILSIAVGVEPRNLQLHVGPLNTGRAQQLIVGSDLQDVGCVIEKLTDFQQVAASGHHEILTLQLSDRRG